MGAPYHNLLSKCDRALAAYIISMGAGTANDTFPAKRSAGKTLPNTTSWSQKGKPYDDGAVSGVYEVDSSIILKMSAIEERNAAADTARLASETRVAKVFDLFHMDVDSSADKLADDISVAGRALAVSDPAKNADMADFTIQNLTIEGVDAGFSEDGDAWLDTLSLKLVCNPGNVS